MSTRHSSSPPSDDDEPTPPRGTPIRDEGRVDPAADSDDEAWDDDWEEPNYLVRRSLVVGGVVILIAVVAIVGSRFIDGGDDSTGAATPEWDTTVVLSRHQIRLLDRDSGDEVETFDSTVDLVDAQSFVGGDALVTLTADGALEIIDLLDGTSRRAAAGSDATLTPSIQNPLFGIVASDAGGDITVVDVADRATFSVADVTELDNPLIFARDISINASGTHVAVPVPSAFQSFVIDVADETFEAYAGRVIAISDDIVVTEQPAGAESEIEFHELGGDRLSSVDVPTPRASMLTNDGELLVVSADGSVQTITSDGKIDQRDPITDEAGTATKIGNGFAAADGERLVVVAGERTVILDAGGTPIGAAVGEVADDSTLATRCIVVSTGSLMEPSTVLDLDDGAVLGTIERGRPAASSTNGCTASLLASPDNLVVNGELVDVDASTIVAIAPDGDGIATQTGRTTELVRLSGDLDPILIADEPVVIHFAQRQ